VTAEWALVREVAIAMTAEWVQAREGELCFSSSQIEVVQKEGQ
jgi:hypothetical protein